MSKPTISITNESTCLTDAQVQNAIPALQVQLDRDFLPAWGLTASLVWTPKGTPPLPGVWQLIVLDNSDQAGALGYHDLTADGAPLGKVFAGTDLHYGTQWTVTLSHELLEMVADPDINRVVFVQSTATSGTLYPVEVSDAVEADAYAYGIPGADGTPVPLSDFVFPSWYETFHPPRSLPFDQGGHVNAAFQLLPGGYTGIFDVNGSAGWQQTTAALAVAASPLGVTSADRFLRPGDLATLHLSRSPVGSRRERRRTPRDRWQRSWVGLAVADDGR